MPISPLVALPRTTAPPGLAVTAVRLAPDGSFVGWTAAVRQLFPFEWSAANQRAQGAGLAQ
jgi:hypothetical protein